MNNEITILDSKGYATEKNLRKALAKRELDQIEGLRYLIVRKPIGDWTAIFLVSDYLRGRGGYVGIASQFGFMSV